LAGERGARRLRTGERTLLHGEELARASEKVLAIERRRRADEDAVNPEPEEAWVAMIREAHHAEARGCIVGERAGGGELVAPGERRAIARIPVGEVEPIDGDDVADARHRLLVSEAPHPVVGAVGRGQVDERRLRLERLEQRVDALLPVVVERERRIELRLGLAHRRERGRDRRRLWRLARQDVAAGDVVQAHARDERSARRRLAVAHEGLDVAIDRRRGVARRRRVGLFADERRVRGDLDHGLHGRVTQTK
jgi:hypothetical protein